MAGRAAAIKRMHADADIQAEATMLAAEQAAVPRPDRESDVNTELAESQLQDDVVPLNVVDFSHTATAQTRALVEAMGGLERLRDFTARFYAKAYADPHLDKFIREHADHHGERFATWIAEKMGLPGRPWTAERAARERCPFHAHGYRIDDAFDRSSAHFAAWHSPKRDPGEWGEHFQLDDCRVWMRLHFWAAREAGVLDTPFGAYYVRFIAHFVWVYERTAPPFARESARWSADPANIERYLANGRTMGEIMRLSTAEALAQLPEDEQRYTGLGTLARDWPYELHSTASAE